MKKTSRILALALVLVLAIGLLPMSAMAAAGDFMVKGHDVTADMTVTAAFAAPNGPIDASNPYSPTAREFPISVVAVPYGNMKSNELVLAGNIPTATPSIKRITEKDVTDFYLNSYDSIPLLATDFGYLGTDVDPRAILSVGDIFAISWTGNFMFFIEIQQAASGTTGSGGADGGLGGGSTVQKGGINVVLPLNLNFVLDPLQLKSSEPGNQIAGDDYQIYNKSSIPVRVTFTIQATASSATVPVPTPPILYYPGSYNPAAPSTDKQAVAAPFLEQSKIDGGAQQFTMGMISAYTAEVEPNFATNARGTFKYRVNETSAYKAFIPMDGSGAAVIGGNGTAISTETSLTFMLDKPASTSAFAANSGSVAAFKFYATLPSSYKWQNGLVSVNGTYTISGVTPTGYENKIGTQTFALNGFDKDREIAADARIEANMVTRLVVSRAKLSENPTNPTAKILTLSLRTDGTADVPGQTNPGNRPSAQPSSIVNKTANYTFTSTDFSYSTTSGILTLNTFPSTNNQWNEIVITAGTGNSARTYTVWVFITP